MLKGRHSRRGLVLLLLGLAVSGITLWLALKETSSADLLTAIATIEWAWSLPMLLAYALHFWLKAVRWRVLLAPATDTTAARLYSPMILGFFANNILPARLGEAIRAVLGARRLAIKLVEVIATLVIERLFDVLCILLLVAAALSFESRMDAELVRVVRSIGLVAGLLLVAVVAATHWTGPLLQLAGRALGFLADSVRDRVLGELAAGLTVMQSLKQFAPLAAILITTLAQWLLMVFALWCSLQALDINVPVAATFVLLGATILAIMLPAAPGYFGAIQLAYVLALKPFGISASVAVSASLCFHLLTYFAVMVAGLYYLRRLGMDVHGLEELSKTADAR